MEKFNISKKIHEFSLSKPGKYTVSFIGGFHASNSGDFKCELRELESKKSIPLKEIFLKTRFYYEKNRAIEFYKFTIKEPANYQIIIKNYEDLELEKSILFFKRTFMPEKVACDKIEVIIK